MTTERDDGGLMARWWLRLWPVTLLGATIAGFAIGGLTGPLTAGLIVPIVAVLAFGALALGRVRPGMALAVLALALLLAGWAWGAARVAVTQPVALQEGGEARGVLALLESPVTTERGARAKARVENLSAADRVALPRGATVLLGFGPDFAVVTEGQRVQVAGDLREAAGRSAPGWWVRWLARNRISAHLEVERAEVVGRRGGVWGLRARWRTWARGHAARGLSGDTGALVRGMLLGGGTELSPSAREEFRASGIWHLLAVSGQNVTVVAIAVLAALRAMFVPRRWALVVAGVAIVAYCLACEGGPSVARAGLMGALGLSTALGGLPRRRWYLLLLSLAIVLGIRPRDIADPGLQLSFSAVAGLYTLSPAAAAVLERLFTRRIAELVATSLGAGLATAPILAWHFGHLSLVGFGLNVVAVPLAAPVVVLALIALAVEPLGPIARIPAELAGLGADALLVGAKLAASVPAASVIVPRASAALLVVLAGAVWAVFAAAARGWYLGRPPGRAVAVCSCAGVALLAVAWWSRPAPLALAQEGSTSLAALDVGQGQAILVDDGTGARALIDVGPPGAPAPAVEALRDGGIERIDQVFISHDAQDHAGGLEDVLDEVAVGEVLAPESAREALVTARRKGVRVRALAQGQELELGRAAISVLWPRAGLTTEDPNDSSLVLDVRSPDLVALVPGDAESHVLERLRLAPVDVLVLAHHGSADPGLGPILRRLRPRLAVVSAGRGNRHGHPAPATVRAIEGAAITLARTDRDGSVVIAP